MGELAGTARRLEQEAAGFAAAVMQWLQGSLVAALAKTHRGALHLAAHSLSMVNVREGYDESEMSRLTRVHVSARAHGAYRIT